MKNKIIIVLLVLVIAIGAFIIYQNGFNLDYEYANTKKININFKESFKIEDIKTMTKEVLGDQSFKIDYIDDFETGVAITTKEVTDEQLESLEAKLKEKYSSFAKDENTDESEGEHTHNNVLQVTNMPAIKTFDIVKGYIMPAGISTVLSIAFLAVMFRKLGVVKRFVISRCTSIYSKWGYH